jgi:hypothetical protein
LLIAYLTRRGVEAEEREGKGREGRGGEGRGGEGRILYFDPLALF